jgi:RNA 3'-terminal phosphate cyclase (ATP)
MGEVCAAAVEGDDLGSRELRFTPGRPRAGRYRLDVGTAGSTLLVLQTVLPGLLGVPGTSELEIIGGTHNPLAPTFEFVRDSLLPLLAAMGADVQLAIERYGFYPKGGGRVRAFVRGPTSWRSLALPERGPVRSRSAEVVLSRLPEHIAVRELDVLHARLGIPPENAAVRQVDAFSPGNAVIVRLVSDSVCQVFSGLGERGVSAEKVANAVADRVGRHLEIAVPVEEHLADQLLVPLALAGGGSFVTPQPSSHTLTNAAVIEAFLPLRVASERIDADRWRIRIGVVP